LSPSSSFPKVITANNYNGSHTNFYAFYSDDETYPRTWQNMTIGSVSGEASGRVSLGNSSGSFPENDGYLFWVNQKNEKMKYAGNWTASNPWVNLTSSSTTCSSFGNWSLSQVIINSSSFQSVLYQSSDGLTISFFNTTSFQEENATVVNATSNVQASQQSLILVDIYPNYTSPSIVSYADLLGWTINDKCYVRSWTYNETDTTWYIYFSNETDNVLSSYGMVEDSLHFVTGSRIFKSSGCVWINSYEGLLFAFLPSHADYPSQPSTPTPTPTPTPFPSEPPMPPSPSTINATWFFRSDAHTTWGVLGYKLLPVQSYNCIMDNRTASGTLSVSYGVRIWIVDIGGEFTELTNGSPEAVVTVNSDGEAYYTAYWDCVGYSYVVDAVQINLYQKFGDEPWNLRRIYITPPDLHYVFPESTWTFIYDISRSTDGSETNCTFYFGSLNHLSRVILYYEKLQPWDEGWIDLITGQYLSFVFMPWTFHLGDLFWGIMVLFFAVTTYNRYHDLKAVLGVAWLFGGVGGVLTLLIPSVGLNITWFILGFAIALTLYKLLR